ncbi:hypothetical protein RJ641_020545 [Dillenia turbinata]|uniref:Uncharacterized protein n=1 Tax=Dillenia turbinata TaxID=194707 RepID=A0AAN8UES0_9MAGN
MSEMKTRVKVHSKLTQVSSTPVKPGKIHPLSVLDQSMGLHTLHMVLYYRVSPFNSFDLDPLRASLCEALSNYPPVTGRLTRDDDGNWVVNCNDAGLRVLRATVGTTLDEWLGSADAFEELDLTKKVKINEFEGGGVAIGLSCTHLNADPTSATLLLKSWSEVHRREAIAHAPFFHPPALRRRPNPNTDTQSANYYATKSKLVSSPTKMSTVTFRFSSHMIKNCLSEVQNKCPNATPFDLLAALFWLRIVLLKSKSYGDQCALSICIDFRKLMQAPLPYGYFGNALHFSLLSTNAEDLEGGDLGHVAELVHSHVAGIEEEEFWSVIDWLDSRREGKKLAPPFRMYGPELTCVSMEHMNAPKGPTESASQPLMYAVMFEKDEKPLHVSYHVGNVEGEGLIMVMPSPEEGLGRTVMVTLPEEQTAKLCEDHDILRLKPTMLLSRR